MNEITILSQGKSEGYPSEQGLQLDAEAALEFAFNHPRFKSDRNAWLLFVIHLLLHRLQGSSMVMFGRSLGGAVSIYLAHKYPNLVKGIIVENTFLSVSAMVDVLMPFLKSIKSFVLNIKWNSDEKIPSLNQPILFISGIIGIISNLTSFLFDVAVQRR